MKKKLLICGISGLTGYKIAKYAKNYDVYGIYNTRPVQLDCQTIQCNILDFDKIHDIFSQIRPDLVINTTALHNVDYCEEHVEESFDVNCNAVKNLYENSERIGAKLVHISTDYVFDGNKTTPYSETDTTMPVSHYGQSKLEGEKILENSNHVIIRPSVVYGWAPMELAGIASSSGKPINFAMWLLTKLYKNENIKIVTDQFASATLADTLADYTIKIGTSNRGGLYHVSGLSCESRYDFSIKLAKEFGYDNSLISKTSSSEFKQKAKRPSYSCLNCNKVIEEFGLSLLTTEQSLQIMRQQVSQEASYLIGNHNT